MKDLSNSLHKIVQSVRMNKARGACYCVKLVERREQKIKSCKEER